MIAATYVVLALAFAGFAFRLFRGPTLADRVIAVDGMLVVGLSAIVVDAVDTGRGAYLQVAVMLTLVSFIGTAVIARFIEGARRMIGKILMLAGAVLTLLSAIGVVRFPDALSRMHALTKASTVGFGLVAIGSALLLPTANEVTSVLLAAGLQLLTLPVAANLIANASYWARRIPNAIEGDDELSDVSRR